MRIPCKGCQRREIGCHGKCPDYVAWQEEHEKEKAKRALEADALDAQIKGLTRMRKESKRRVRK